MRTPQHKRPLWIGVLLASLAPWLCILVALLVDKIGDPSFTDMISTSAMIFVIAFPVSLAAMLVLGLPYVLWLRSRGALNALTICAGAVAAGAITFALSSWGMSWDHRAPGLPQLLFGAGLGLAAGVAFCLGAGPNNSFKPKPLRGSA